MKWYQRDPHRAAEGMRELTFEEKGFYNDLIDAYLARDGRLPMDCAFLASMTGSDIRVIRRLLEALARKGKVRSRDGGLIPNGCEVTLKSAKCFVEVQRIRAKKRWENNETGDAKAAMPIQPYSKEERKDAALRAARGEAERECGGRAEPPSAAPASPEVELFRRGRELGISGGMVKLLLKAKGSSVPLARAALEMASTKGTPREYIGAIINRPGGVGKVHNSPYV